MKPLIESIHRSSGSSPPRAKALALLGGMLALSAPAWAAPHTARHSARSAP